MIRLLLTILVYLGFAVFIFAFYSCFKGLIYISPYSITQIQYPPMIRIALGKYFPVKNFTLSVKGGYTLSDLFTQKELKINIPHRVWVYARGGKIYLGDQNSGLCAIKITPLKSSFIELNGDLYRGNLTIYCIGESLRVINELDLESYIAGVVGKEMDPKGPENAILAQIITARSFALYELISSARAPERRFDLYDDIRSQVYGGVRAETERLKKLVRKTRGTVLTYLGEIFRTYYSSCCGGHTEPAWEIFKGEKRIPPLSGRKCIYCKGTKYFSWSRKITKKELLEKLFPEKKPSDIIDLKITRYAPGGHALEIALKVPEKEVVLDAYGGFRLKLGLRSTLFTILHKKDYFLFEGRGYGHGVGLCQKGAINMAKNPLLNYVDILNYYYPGAELVKLY